LLQQKSKGKDHKNARDDLKELGIRPELLFFDLMLHLIAHLATEIWFLGPSYLHQIFHERFYGFLKSLVHNRLFLEGAIVRGYETIEAVEWAMGYMDPQNPIGVPRSRHEGRLSGVGTMGKRSVTLDADAFQKAHFTAIQ
jgi:hypothetical protein